MSVETAIHIYLPFIKTVVTVYLSYFTHVNVYINMHM